MDATQLTLSELNLLIRDTFDEKFPGLVWVKAEISEMTINRNGHCYLELVDTDPVTNQVVARARATVWAYTFRMMKPYFETTTGQAFTNGLKIMVSAKVEFHQLYGFSLNIRDIDPAYTMGDLALKRREIILKLQQDGVFEMNRELELPLVPQRIAVISSPTAAGLQDFLNQLADNPSRIYFHTHLFPATMQGSQTAASIIDALEQIYPLEESFDVVVIIRGGGAQLDLASFDNYELAFHVAQFPLPVITGIGHDKDETIVDLVAHTKMKTPTAVAEFLISGAESFLQRILETEIRCNRILTERLKKENTFMQQAAGRMKQGVRERIMKETHQFNIRLLRLKNSVPAYLRLQDRHFMQHRHRIQVVAQEHIREKDYFLKMKTADLHTRLNRSLENGENTLALKRLGLKSSLTAILGNAEARLILAEEKIRLVDPVHVLKRGYSLTWKDGKLLKTINDLRAGDQLVTRLYDGEVTSRVSGIDAGQPVKKEDC